MVRVRMPDGVVLQGDFGRREPAGAVREFVARALREPHRTFSLTFLGKPVTEDDEGGAAAKAAAEREQAKRLGGKGAGYAAAGTVEGAGLFPSALVTLKWTDANTDGGKAAPPPRSWSPPSPSSERRRWEKVRESTRKHETTVCAPLIHHRTAVNTVNTL